MHKISYVRKRSYIRNMLRIIYLDVSYREKKNVKLIFFNNVLVDARRLASFDWPTTRMRVHRELV